MDGRVVGLIKKFGMEQDGMGSSQGPSTISQAGMLEGGVLRMKEKKIDLKNGVGHGA